jgi:hypothetical protein
MQNSIMRRRSTFIFHINKTKATLSKKISLSITFYRNYFIASTIISICSISALFKYGLNTFGIIFWFKILSYVPIYMLVNELQSRKYYYYLNLGVSKLLLWIITLLMDISIFFFVLIYIIKFL